MFRILLLSLFSAVLCALSLPNEIFPLGIWFLGFIALAPLYFALRKAESHRQAFFIGALFGAVHHALISYWLFFYKDFAFYTLGSTTLAYVVVYGVCAMYGAFLVRSTSGWRRPLIFAIAWTVFEFQKSIGFLGYPWGLIPYSLTSLPILLQIADITGVYGLSFILAYSSAIFADISSLAQNKKSLIAQGTTIILAILGLLVYGGLALSTTYEKKAEIQAVLVQQNTDPWIEGEIAALEANVSAAHKVLDEVQNSSGRVADLVIFSETSLRRPYEDFKSWFSKNPSDLSLTDFLRHYNVHLLTGAPIVLDWNTYEASNSVILIDSEGVQHGSYAKIHPVPFAEAIPLWEYEWFRKFMRETVGIEGGWVMGTRISLFTLPLQTGGKVQFATPICFEDAFSNLCRQYILQGAELFINLTNDSWSQRESAQVQHWAIARFRAIENRRTLVRSTNSGVSCVIDPTGRNILELPQFTGTAAFTSIPVYASSSLTFYTRYGDLFARSLVALLCFWALSLLIRTKGTWPRLIFPQVSV